MREQDIEVLKRALYDALSYRTYAQESREESDQLSEQFTAMLRDLSTVVWELWIWKDGELYTGKVSSDPRDLLYWAATYGTWDAPPQNLSEVEAFRSVLKDYNNMDISFTVVKKYCGDILVFEQENAEHTLIQAAKELDHQKDWDNAMMRLVVEVEGHDHDDIAIAVWSIDSQIEDEGATEGKLRANGQRCVWWIEDDVEPLDR